MTRWQSVRRILLVYLIELSLSRIAQIWQFQQAQCPRSGTGSSETDPSRSRFAWLEHTAKAGHGRSGIPALAQLRPRR